MVRASLAAGAFVALAFLSACQAGTPGPSAGPTPAGPTPPAAAPTPPAAAPTPPAADAPLPDSGGVFDGIYTLAQAERGQVVYEASCAECHEVQVYTESQFKNRWEGRWAIQLWYYIHDRMPYGNPFSLTRQQVTDVFTYILQLNGAPTGNRELGIDDPSLMPYMINWGSMPGT